MDLNLHAMFAVPFGTAQLPDSPSLNRELRSLVLRLEAEGAKHRNPAPVMRIPPGLYESDFSFFSRTEPCVIALREFCWGALSELVRGLNGRSEEQRQGLRIHSHTWFHITRDGGWFGHHTHPMASWSGVYCVDAGLPTTGVPDNGALTFPHPLPAASTYLDAGNSEMGWPYGHANYAMNLAPGQLVLFPSWLAHSVTPFRGAGERITVAFNCWFEQT